MIELKNAELLQKSVDVISSFISEGNFRFSTDGVSFRAMDPSQIVLVDYSIAKSIFDSYSVEPTLAGIDVGEFAKILNRIQPKDRLLMDVSDNELTIKLEGQLSRSFNLPLLDISDDEVKLPSYKFDATVEIDGKILKESLRDASLFGSSLVLKIKNGEFLIEAKGSQGTLCASSKKSKGIIVKSSVDEIVCKYSLNYLMNMLKGADAETKVKLELKTDNPMKVSYPIGATEMQFHIAHMML